MSGEKDDSYVQMGFGVLINVAYHPIAYTKTLIQLGHEPLPSFPVRTFSGRTKMCYPNFFKYMSHVRRQDGWLGVYNGLLPRIAAQGISAYTASYVTMVAKKSSFIQGLRPAGEEKDGSLNDIKRNCIDTGVEIVARCSGVVISQPFYVIMVRQMAQFVGHETGYNGIPRGLVTIWKEEGILGFFSGLAARLLNEALTVLLVNALVYVTDRYVLGKGRDPSFGTVCNLVCSMVATEFTYPFSLSATVMAANTSGLALCSEPLMPRYSSFVDCMAQLARDGQNKRGASMLSRYVPVPRTSGPKIQ